MIHAEPTPAVVPLLQHCLRTAQCTYGLLRCIPAATPIIDLLVAGQANVHLPQTSCCVFRSQTMSAPWSAWRLRLT